MTIAFLGIQYPQNAVPSHWPCCKIPTGQYFWAKLNTPSLLPHFLYLARIRVLRCIFRPLAKLTLLLYLAHIQSKIHSPRYELQSQAPHEPRFGMVPGTLSRCKPKRTIVSVPQNCSFCQVLLSPLTLSDMKDHRGARIIHCNILDVHVALFILLRGRVFLSGEKRRGLLAATVVSRHDRNRILLPGI